MNTTVSMERVQLSKNETQVSDSPGKLIIFGCISNILYIFNILY